MKKYEQVKAAVVGLVLSSAVIPVAMADDIEIYVNNSSETSEVNPNILFMVDNSGSMSKRSEVREYYDPGTTYDGASSSDACESDGIYFVPLGGGKPDCSASPKPTNYFNRSALVCDNAKYLYRADGVKESPAVELALQLFGTYSDQFARRDESIKNTARWEQLPATITASAQRDYFVECLADSGLHGPGTGSNHYMIDETGGNSDGYTSTAPVNLTVPHPVWNNGEGHRTLWDGNYLNYLTDPNVGTITPTRLEQVQRAVLIMASTNNRVNIGLIAFDDNYEANGGGIQYAMKDIVSTRNDFKSRVNGLQPNAWTTLSETYYEALLYYGGKDIDYGTGASPSMNGDAKRGGNLNYKYESPISSTCGANYIVVLSDGTPTNDDANTQKGTVDRFDALPGMSKLTCNTDPTFYTWANDGNDGTKIWDDNLEPDVASSTIDNCLDELAGWAATQDVATDDADPFHKGMQNIITHTIGFDLDVANNTDDAAADTLLKSTAEMGGGQNHLAENGEKLVDIFQGLIDTALKVNTTFSSPAVSVNAFNRSTHLDDLYFTLFKPHATNNAWHGNLKKYKLAFDEDDVPFIADKAGVDAVDRDTGFFKATATSFWSDNVDGLLVEKGGAASKLSTTGTNPRKVYTITGAMTDADANGVYEPANGILVNVANEVDEANSDLTDALLGITGKLPILDAIPYRQTMIDWAAGKDVFNSYGVEDTLTDARLNMGDPLHAEPALVQYRDLAAAVDPLVPALVAYVATNDGYLHAFDAKDGSEVFSFIPQELLTGLPAIMENNGGDKAYGLDGSVIAWVDDVADDGIIQQGTDRVVLYFGMRRGGRNIYAVDVTAPKEPKLLWVIKGGVGDYAELGQTWSTVNVETIKDGADDKAVLVFGGGYDATQDNALVRRPDGMGRTVFIADAVSGKRLWSARDDVAGLDAAMLYGVPARVTTADVSGDGYTDRIYASDVGGQIFRFDINNKTITDADTSLSGSVSGARIADLAGAAAEDARRFYYPLDVALVDAAPDGKYHALVASSGFRAHPLNTEIHDRIYMIKDRHTGLLTNNDVYNYNPTTPNAAGWLTESDLKDVTANKAGGDSATDADRNAELALIQAKAGWYINLDNEEAPGTWIGEKGLAEPLIIEGVAIVTTYIPAEPDTESCVPPEGTGAVFYLDIVDATPEHPLKTEADADVRSERRVILSRGGIPPSPNVIITKDGKAGCVGTECDVISEGIGIRKTYWYEVEK